MSKKASNILILSLVAVTIIGIIVGIWIHTSQQKFINEKTFSLNKQTQTKMEVNLTDFCPDMSVSYEIHLKANKSDSFNIAMNFEKTGADSLAQFIDVEIRLCGEKIDGDKLSEYLEGKQVTFKAEFDNTSEVDVEIVFSMDIEVGDEAQNKAADFDIVLSAKR